MDSSVPLFPSRTTKAATAPSTSTPFLIRAPLSYDDSTDVTDGGSIGATDSDIESFDSSDEREFDTTLGRNEYLGFNNKSVNMAFTPKARISVDDEDDDDEEYGGLEEVMGEGDFSGSAIVPPAGEAEGVEDAKDGVLIGPEDRNVPSLDEEMLVEEEKPYLLHQNGVFDDVVKCASEGTDDGDGLDDVNGKADDVHNEDEGFYQGSSYPFEADENSDMESSDLTAERNLQVSNSHELVNHQIDEAMVDEDDILDVASSSVDSLITQEPKLDGSATTDDFDGSITLKFENESEQTSSGVGDEPVGIGTNSTAVFKGQISSDMETRSFDLINDDCNELRNEREVKLQQYGVLQDTDDEGKMRDLIEATKEEREKYLSEIDDKKKDDTVCEETRLKLDHEKGIRLVDPVQTSAGQENSKQEEAHDEQKMIDSTQLVAYGNNEEPQLECHYVKNGSIVDEEPPAKLGGQDEKRPNEIVLTSAIIGESSDEEESTGLEQTYTELVLYSKEVVSNSHAAVDGWRSAVDAELPSSFCEDCEDLQNSREVTSDKSEKINVSGNYDEDEDSVSSIISEEPALVSIFERSESSNGFIKDLDDGFCSISSAADNYRGFSNQINCHIVPESDKGRVIEEADDVEKLLDPAFLEARSCISPDGPATLTASDSTRFFRSSLFDHPDPAVIEHDNNNLKEEDRRLQEKVEKVHLKFLQLVHRLGYSSEENVATAHVHMLDLVGATKLGRGRSHFFSRESIVKKAVQLKKDQERLEFSCNILVIGKTGVGKSAVINSIFRDQITHTSAFQPATTSVKVVFGIIDEVKIQIMDTPGLSPSPMDYGSNRKILLSIRKHMKKFSPDCVLYVDRLDTSSGNSNDLPLFRSISDVLGFSIWDNVVVTLTHAGSPPPDGSDGTPLHYDVFMQKRYNVIRDFIRKEVGCSSPIPMAFVENHPSCKTNGGEKVLPNGIRWRQRLLLLCYSLKIISESKSILEVKKSSHIKIFGFCIRSPPLLYLLSSLLQSRSDPHLTADRSIHNSDSYLDLMDLSDSEKEDGDDRLHCFKSLRKLQIAKLSKEQQKACLEGCDYQVKLLQKKQMDQELSRVKEMKRSEKEVPDVFGNCGVVRSDDDQDENLATGLKKIEDQVAIRRKMNLEADLGTLCSQIDLESGLNIDEDEDYPVGHDTSNLGICLLRWRNDLVVMSNLQFQFSVGRKSNMGVHLVLNNKRTGQITVKTNTSHNLQVALLGLLPIFISIFRGIWPGESSLS